MKSRIEDVAYIPPLKAILKMKKRNVNVILVLLTVKIAPKEIVFRVIHQHYRYLTERQQVLSSFPRTIIFQMPSLILLATPIKGVCTCFRPKPIRLCAFTFVALDGGLSGLGSLEVGGLNSICSPAAKISACL